MSTVVIHLTPDEIEAILTKTDIAKTKKLGPRLEAMGESQQDVDLSVNEWGRMIFSLCGAKQEAHVSKQLMTIARKIAERMSEVPFRASRTMSYRFCFVRLRELFSHQNVLSKTFYTSL